MSASTCVLANHISISMEFGVPGKAGFGALILGSQRQHVYWSIPVLFLWSLVGPCKAVVEALILGSVSQLVS